MKRFEGKQFLVAGGSSGIGLATAQRLAGEGAKVILIARDRAKLEAAVSSLPGIGHCFRSVDITSEAEMAPVLKELKEQQGLLHGVICCAGAHEIRPLVVSAAKNYEDLFRQNVISAVNCLRLALRSMAAEGGSYVVVSSVAGLRGAAGASAYAAAKGALLALTKSLAVELAPKRIRVNAVVPGVVETPMTVKFLGALPAPNREAIVRAHPLGLGKPEDVAAVIAFLASDDARWMTGAEVVVDGGLNNH